jgi:hypothetical protein
VGGLLPDGADGLALDPLGKLDDRVQARGVSLRSRGPPRPLEKLKRPLDVTSEEPALRFVEPVGYDRPPDLALIIRLRGG